jgi:endonuclease YncB( thermonuclease family)
VVTWKTLYIAAAMFTASAARADAVKPADIYVVDGDTIEALGKPIRLVGFDAPELGGHAHCGLERMLAARATSRLRQIIRYGGGGTSTCGWVACSRQALLGFVSFGISAFAASA